MQPLNLCRIFVNFNDVENIYYRLNLKHIIGLTYFVHYMFQHGWMAQWQKVGKIYVSVGCLNRHVQSSIIHNHQKG
jgi:hypothetical protein